MKTVIVTGCFGFIGTYVTKTCLAQGWRVMGIDKLTYCSDIQKGSETFPFNSGNGWRNFKFLKQDINDIEYLPEVDYIINTAAETHVDNSIVGNHEFVNSNINGVHHILELIRNKRGYNMPTLLHFSTDEVYGDITTGSHTETDILKPSNPYSATKAAADMLIQGWNRTYNVPYVIVRPTNNYGVGQYIEKLIPKSVKYLTLNKLIPLHNNGTPVRSWLHAQDTANAVITIIESGVKNEIYNIGGSCEKSNIEVVYKIIDEYYARSVSNRNQYIDFSTHRQGQDIRYSLDDNKLRKLGWKPTKIFENELTNIVKFYTHQFIW